MVDHCGLPYERDPATMQLWRNGQWQTCARGGKCRWCGGGGGGGGRRAESVEGGRSVMERRGGCYEGWRLSTRINVLMIEPRMLCWSCLGGGGGGCCYLGLCRRSGISMHEIQIMIIYFDDLYYKVLMSWENKILMFRSF